MTRSLAVTSEHLRSLDPRPQGPLSRPGAARPTADSGPEWVSSEQQGPIWVSLRAAGPHLGPQACPQPELRERERVLVFTGTCSVTAALVSVVTTHLCKPFARLTHGGIGRQCARREHGTYSMANGASSHTARISKGSAGRQTLPLDALLGRWLPRPLARVRRRCRHGTPYHGAQVGCTHTQVVKKSTPLTVRGADTRSHATGTWAAGGRQGPGTLRRVSVLDRPSDLGRRRRRLQ